MTLKANLTSNLAPQSVFSLHQSDAHPCSYKENEIAREQIVVPVTDITPDNYGDFLNNGFRRSGFVVYRPNCKLCSACLSLRILVDSFKMSRTQQRCFAANANLIAQQMPLQFNAEHYALYQRYQAARHKNGGMDQGDENDYAAQLNSLAATELWQFTDINTEGNALRMASLIDISGDGISAVYSFFDPDFPKQSLGTYNILWLIEEAKKRKLPYVYLGYFIKDSPKMHYKINFSPAEILQNGAWQKV